MKVLALAWRPFALPLRSMVRAAHGAVSVREGLLLRVETDAPDVVGLGEASPLPSYGGGSVSECEDLLRCWAPDLAGRTAEDAWAHPPQPAGTPGSVAATRCGIESALADALSRRAGLPLHAWLRGDGRSAAAASEPPDLAVNALVDDLEPADAAASARDRLAEGFTTLKLKAGVDANRDAERVAAVRAAVGPDIELRVDANGAWPPGVARTLLAACLAAGVALVEQPIAPAHGPEALATLRRTFPGVAIAADEGCRTIAQLEALLAARAVDAIVLKPMMTGLGEALRMAALAAERGLPVVVTTTFDSGVGTVLAAHLAAAIQGPSLAHGLGTHVFLDGDIVSGVPPVRHGRMVLPAAPGLGVTLDEAALEQFATGPWREVRA